MELCEDRRNQRGEAMIAPVAAGSQWITANSGGLRQ